MCYYWYHYYSIVQMRKLRQRAVNNFPKASTSSKAKSPVRQAEELTTPRQWLSNLAATGMTLGSFLNY